MCMSRLHRVVSLLDDTRVAVCDLDGRQTTASLLAYEGPPLKVGDWLVAQSGFALAPADTEEAEVRAVRARDGTRQERTMKPHTQRVPLPGLVFAGMTALVSGVSVFVNSYGVRSISDAAVYTTAKNLVAAVLLVAIAGLLGSRRSPNRAMAGRPESARRHSNLLRWLGLGYVGVVGGGVAFVLFFEGLARTTATPAAFLHDTMVAWVALLAMAFLRERPSSWNIGAIVLLFVGEVAVAGGIGHLVAGQGELLVLEATVLWAVETVVAKRLLQSIAPTSLAVVRMGIGVVVLLGFLLVTGHLGALTGLDAARRDGPW